MRAGFEFLMGLFLLYSLFIIPVTRTHARTHALTHAHSHSLTDTHTHTHTRHIYVYINIKPSVPSSLPATFSLSLSLSLFFIPSSFFFILLLPLSKCPFRALAFPLAVSMYQIMSPTFAFVMRYKLEICRFFLIIYSNAHDKHSAVLMMPMMMTRFVSCVRRLRLLGLQCFFLLGWSVSEWVWRSFGGHLRSVYVGELQQHLRHGPLQITASP